MSDIACVRAGRFSFECQCRNALVFLRRITSFGTALVVVPVRIGARGFAISSSKHCRSAVQRSRSVHRWRQFDGALSRGVMAIYHARADVYRTGGWHQAEKPAIIAFVPNPTTLTPWINHRLARGLAASPWQHRTHDDQSTSREDHSSACVESKTKTRWLSAWRSDYEMQILHRPPQVSFSLG